MPVHDRSRSDQDERFGPPGPERSQHNPEQLVQGSQSTARSLRVQSQQLLTESQVFKDELLPGIESADHPSEEMPERHDHGKNLIGTIRIQLFAKSFILQVYDVAAGLQRGPTRTYGPGTPVASSSVCSSCAICCAVRGSRAGTRDFETVPICATLKETEHDSVPQPYQTLGSESHLGRKLQRACRKLVRNAGKRQSEAGAGSRSIAPRSTVAHKVSMVENVESLGPEV